MIYKFHKKKYEVTTVMFVSNQFSSYFFLKYCSDDFSPIATLKFTFHVMLHSLLRSFFFISFVIVPKKIELKSLQLFLDGIIAEIWKF